MLQETSLETFGPFLLAAVVFAAGAIGYFALLALSRLVRGDGESP